MKYHCGERLTLYGVLVVVVDFNGDGKNLILEF